MKGMIQTIRQTETKGSNAIRPQSLSVTARMHSHRGRTMYNIAWYAPEHKKNQNRNTRKIERGKSIMLTKKAVDAKKADLIDKIVSMTPDQFDLLVYLLDHHEEIDILDEPARTAKMQELKEEFMAKRQADKASKHAEKK